MTDKDALFLYRMKQSRETLTDAENMLKGNLTPRSITNRVYYSMFYMEIILYTYFTDAASLNPNSLPLSSAVNL